MHIDFSDEMIRRVCGGLFCLASHSEVHRHYLIGDLYERLLPSLQTNCYRYYEDAKGCPIAFCNWTFLSFEAIENISKTNRHLHADEWNDNGCSEKKAPYFVEWIAPFGHTRIMARDLQSQDSLRRYYDYKKSMGIKNVVAYSTRIRSKNNKNNNLDNKVGKFYIKP